MLDMQGGKVIGEGVDGCVLSEPTWPCAAGTAVQGAPPNPMDQGYVSKILSKDDTESEYLRAAARLIGPLSKKYLAGIQGECSPANSAHPPSGEGNVAYKTSKAAVIEWKKKGQACGDLSKDLKEGKGITDTHKILYISRYPMTVLEWTGRLKKPVTQVISETVKAIPEFLQVLQSLYQNSSEQLIHIDLHVGNIFVRPNQVQFGIADFGHCLLRQKSDTPEKQARGFFGKYLTRYITGPPFYTGYSQVPLEARILDFCYKKNMVSVNPGNVVKAWALEASKEISESTDLIVYGIISIIDTLLLKPQFIAMVEKMQSICRKLRENPTNHLISLSSEEQVVLEFIITRYSVISPINTITQAVMTLSPSQLKQEAIKTLENTLRKNKRGIYTTEFHKLIEFLALAIIAPYSQVGSSLTTSLTAVQSGDLRIIWSKLS